MNAKQTQTKKAAGSTASGNGSESAKASDRVPLRSRYRNYKVRGVQFENFCAEVDAATLKTLETVSGYGVGNEFWVDAQVEPEE